MINKIRVLTIAIMLVAGMFLAATSITPVTGNPAAPVCGTYTIDPGMASTWQTYWNDGQDVYGDGPFQVGNVIMAWQSIMNSKWDLCPNTLVGTVDIATDLIITNVDPSPAVVGTVVTYSGGQLQLDESVWGGTAGTKQMVDLDGATATISSVNLDDQTVTMDIVATGTFVDYPGFGPLSQQHSLIVWLILCQVFLVPQAVWLFP